MRKSKTYIVAVINEQKANLKCLLNNKVTKKKVARFLGVRTTHINNGNSEIEAKAFGFSFVESTLSSLKFVKRLIKIFIIFHKLPNSYDNIE